MPVGEPGAGAGLVLIQYHYQSIINQLSSSIINQYNDCITIIITLSTSRCRWASLVQGQGLLCAIGKPGIVPGHLDDVGVVNDDDGDEYDIAGALVIATVKGVGLIRPIHDTN